MITSLAECEGKIGRMCSICNGTSDLPREKENQYRALWGLADLPQEKSFDGSMEPEQVSNAVPSRPALLQQVRTFLSALTAHVKDGLAKCDDAEIQTRLAICQQCPEFTGAHCRKCGCACNGRSKFFNKLAWRSESCPLGKWLADS